MRLFQILSFRLIPLIGLKMCKNRKRMKVFFCLLVFCYIAGVIMAIRKLVGDMKRHGVVWLVLAMFPQYIFYGFVFLLLGRCIWKSWSERVWKRIFKLSVIGTIFGALMENYLNTLILGFFVEKI